MTQGTAAKLASQPHKLKTGEEYKESLKDNRQIWVGGQKLNSVYDEPALAKGIDLLASMFDDQFTEEHADATTYYDEKAGAVLSRSWQIPRTKEDLAARRRMIEYTSLKTAGTFGRPPDLAPSIVVGLYAYLPTFKKKKSLIEGIDPDFAENIERYMEYGQNNNLTASESLAGPQADRSSPKASEASLLKARKVTKDGVYIYGAKTVGSIAAQANDIFFTNLGGIQETPADACIWGSVPIDTPGIKMISREMVSQPLSSKFDHPVASLGEEADQFIVFDNVFVPKERLFNLGDPTAMSYYGPVCVFAHWHVLTRLAVKAELFVGAGQMVLDYLGTGKIPAVQMMLGQLVEYAQTLRAFVTAAEALAVPTEGDVMRPDVGMLTAGRLYSIENYPKIIHILQEMCGQGLVMRFGKKAFDNPEVGHFLHELLPGHGVSAMVKEQLMNFIWDMTSGSLAGRVALFENVNATPAPALRARLYNEVKRDGYVAQVKKIAGIE
ncbi:4-hydroxyphenylacetate 3-monooxygenase [Brucella pituitosa]|uniref:4-hydroxyphenylacetate 3-monooxygenase n=1 Tax=Brucella pituitosa TaxID=571256 RepID=A0ABS3JZE9_9HYPH|nr:MULTISPECIES: 4-hydroxyphenylacetate 3-hydroxylase N-terminal domain-containing protein [Brucella]PQZ50777.1 4-hydroxyphenylacetate 3-monooxygenase [Ochrobactrum sp. MYb19]PRA52075.1 4-hydroxyphenylacetate 3-monooxygenase [Ochrobactrum sp. MYb68]PRA68817.1 4-hydroxyphenylacetate 3-monooxygenase [Ochrobactrum sp. MYb18]PRA73955.1 4-hydroxyphenylacetate 3-monooxygenase [Brucella thiophenivorans]PRA84921.1 4-hydroxyphenylacetate 3-monooxygenase [Ochrobactrum sp. MYb29]PRA91069.1 4-hydroxyphen